MQKIITLFTAMIFSFSLLAQEARNIHGVVINAETQEPIPYANLGIEGTFVGGASDENGEFNFNVNKDYFGEEITVSAIGYFSITIPWNATNSEAALKVKLKEQTFSIDVVDIQAQSLVLYRILKVAGKNMHKYYINEPYSMSAHYEFQNNSQTTISHQTSVSYTDNKGYQPLADSVLFKNYGYSISSVKANKKEDPSLNNHAVYINDLLKLDLGKWNRGIFNPNLLRDFKLSKSDEQTTDGQKTIIVDYELMNPSFEITFDPYTTEYKGRVYINMEDTTIVKNEVWAQASNFSSLSYNHFTKRSTKKPNHYYLSSTYHKTGDKYFLESIQFSRQTDEETPATTKANLHVTQVSKGIKRPINNKVFYWWK